LVSLLFGVERFVLRRILVRVTRLSRTHLRCNLYTLHSRPHNSYLLHSSSSQLVTRCILTSCPCDSYSSHSSRSSSHSRRVLVHAHIHHQTQLCSSPLVYAKLAGMEKEGTTYDILPKSLESVACTATSKAKEKTGFKERWQEDMKATRTEFEMRSTLHQENVRFLFGRLWRLSKDVKKPKT